MERMGLILPDYVDIRKRPSIMLVGRRLDVQTEANIPRFDLPINLLKSSQRVGVSLPLDARLLPKFWVNEGKAFVPGPLVEPLIHLIYSRPERFTAGSTPGGFRDSAHGSNRSRRTWTI